MEQTAKSLEEALAKSILARLEAAGPEPMNVLLNLASKQGFTSDRVYQALEQLATREAVEFTFDDDLGVEVAALKGLEPGGELPKREFKAY